MSTLGGVQNAPVNAAAIGARAFALFTSNQRQWKARPVTGQAAELFRKNLTNAGFDPSYILPHDSYLINLGHPEPEKNQRSLNAFMEELDRCTRLGLRMLNFHPGSHLRAISETECLELIASNMIRALEAYPEMVLVVENTAGQGSNVGYRFEHIAYLIELLPSEFRPRAGVCLDTCHAFAAGYDISNARRFLDVMDEFNTVIGLEYLKACHLNDSKKGCGSRVDRHAPLGKGRIGLKPFRFIMEEPAFNRIPLILETPDRKRWPKEIAMLYSFMPAEGQGV